MLLNILTNVSWLNYLVIIALLLAAYYLFVGVKYYSDELKEIFTLKRHGGGLKPALDKSNGSTPSLGEDGEPIDDYDLSDGFEHTTDETFELVERLISTLKVVVQDSADNQMDKAEFTDRLRKILEFYGDLKNSQFQFAVNELIISECEKIDFVPLSEDELMKLW